MSKVFIAASNRIRHAFLSYGTLVQITFVHRYYRISLFAFEEKIYHTYVYLLMLPRNNTISE